MKANKRSDTKPELLLRRELHRRGLRFRTTASIRLEGSRPIHPDIIFTRWRIAIFVDGCYWHGCPDYATQPRANAAYWSAKLTSNRERDVRQTAALEAAGWSVLRAWEHEPVAAAADRIASLMAVKRPD